MPELLVRPTDTAAGPLVSVTPASAGWSHVHFEVRRLAPGVACAWPADALERCLVVLEGEIDLTTDVRRFDGVARRGGVFGELPAAVFAGAETAIEAVAGTGGAEVAVCAAPGVPGYAPYRVEPAEISVERRGTGAMEREVRPILMGDRPAHSLLVVEVLTPAGHWSSYPPHKHDVDDPPRETLLEETYFHRVDPPQGFGLQRIYDADGQLDETVAFADRDTVLVPRGYHAVAMPPGYDGWYLNVMAGPRREWRFADDPAHTRLRTW